MSQKNFKIGSYFSVTLLYIYIYIYCVCERERERERERKREKEGDRKVSLYFEILINKK